MNKINSIRFYETIWKVDGDFFRLGNHIEEREQGQTRWSLQRGFLWRPLAWPGLARGRPLLMLVEFAAAQLMHSPLLALKPLQNTKNNPRTAVQRKKNYINSQENNGNKMFKIYYLNRCR